MSFYFLYCLLDGVQFNRCPTVCMNEYWSYIFITPPRLAFVTRAE